MPRAAVSRIEREKVLRSSWAMATSARFMKKLLSSNTAVISSGMIW